MPVFNRSSPYSNMTNLQSTMPLQKESAHQRNVVIAATHSG